MCSRWSPSAAATDRHPVSSAGPTRWISLPAAPAHTTARSASPAAKAGRSCAPRGNPVAAGPLGGAAEGGRGRPAQMAKPRHFPARSGGTGAGGKGSRSGGQASPRRTAWAAAAAREGTSSLARIAATWLEAVRRVMKRAAAIAVRAPVDDQTQHLHLARRETGFGGGRDAAGRGTTAAAASPRQRLGDRRLRRQRGARRPRRREAGLPQRAAGRRRGLVVAGLDDGRSGSPVASRSAAAAPSSRAARSPSPPRLATRANPTRHSRRATGSPVRRASASDSTNAALRPRQVAGVDGRRLPRVQSDVAQLALVAQAAERRDRLLKVGKRPAGSPRDADRTASQCCALAAPHSSPSSRASATLCSRHASARANSAAASAASPSPWQRHLAAGDRDVAEPAQRRRLPGPVAQGPRQAERLLGPGRRRRVVALPLAHVAERDQRLQPPGRPGRRRARNASNQRRPSGTWSRTTQNVQSAAASRSPPWAPRRRPARPAPPAGWAARSPAGRARRPGRGRATAARPPPPAPGSRPRGAAG